ncbi:hypothetical protein G7054_g12796 [Neopestalotiopsis clavispora]|nr:hypothetical protein G7054_g12796 [Neopestalotiopsis clavispora]
MDIDPSKDASLFSPESRATVVIGVAVALMLCATTAVVLRLYTRKIILNQLGLDDWLSIGALFFTLATGVSQCYRRHIGTLPRPDGFKDYMKVCDGSDSCDDRHRPCFNDMLTRLAKNFYVVLIWYNIAIGLIKMTFLTQYYRVLPTSRVRKLCIVAMVIVGSWSLSQILLTIFLCVPISGFWDSSVEASCIPTPAEWYQNAAGNIVTDVAIFCLPFPVLRRLNLPRAQLPRDLEAGPSKGTAATRRLSGSDSDFIFGLEDYNFETTTTALKRDRSCGLPSSNPFRHAATATASAAATTTISTMALGSSSNVESPPWTAQAGLDKTWKQPIIAARIHGGSNASGADGNDNLPRQHGIQVQHDITVQTSRW